MSDIGNLIKRRREELNIAQAQLSERIDEPQSVVSLWESGERVPGPEKIPKLADALHVWPRDLLPGEGRDHGGSCEVVVRLPFELDTEDLYAVERFARFLKEGQTDV